MVKRILLVIMLCGVGLAQNNPNFTGTVSINPPGTSGNVNTGTVNGTIGYQISGNYSQGATYVSTATGTVFGKETLNATAFTGADMCAKIAAALAACTGNGCTVDARGFTGAQACATNPVGGSATAFTVLLGAATITTTKQWYQNTTHRAHIIGIGAQGGGAPGQNTRIIADATITADANWTAHPAVIRMAPDATTTFEQEVAKLGIDCASVTGGVGVYTSEAQELSDFHHLQIYNCDTAGIILDQVTGNNAGASGTQNNTLHDLYINCGNAACVNADGIDLYFINRSAGQADGPNTIENVTIVGATGANLRYGIYINGLRGGRFNHFHCEFMVDCVYYGDTAFVVTPTGGCVASCDGASFGATFISIQANNTITDSAIHIKKTNVGWSQGNFLFINKGNGGNVVIDDTNQVTETSAGGANPTDYIIGGTRTPPRIFSKLPTCNANNEGQTIPVTDSTVNTWGTTIAGGGAFNVQAFCDAAAWTVSAK